MTENEFLLQDRLGVIRDTIAKYGEENFYMSFSGGKDSTVLHNLVDMAMPGNRIPRVFSNTGIEYNAIVEYVREREREDDRFVIILPKQNIKQTLEKVGYPIKSKQFSDAYYCYRNHKQEIWDVMAQIDQDPSLRYDYEFIHNLPKKTKFVIKEYYGVRDRESNKEVYQFRGGCPIPLRKMFKEDYNISDKCCLEMKEKPLDRWAREHNKKHRILGLMRDEDGRRSDTKCMAFKGDRLSFHPLAVVSKEWEEWFIQEHNIKLCKLYYDPYNFERTGCKGCPFNVELEENLSTIGKYFPNERKQIEYLWKPVYDIYRKLGYRLSSEEQIKLF